MSASDAIVCDRLSVRFGDFLAVDELSFRVPRCSLFGFLGPNGAGKSTTVSVLCTLLAPSGGRAEVAGFDVQRAPQEVRSRIGVLFQDPCVDDRLTGLENLKLHALVYGVPRAERKARMEQAVELTGLGASIDQVVRTYSGGMRRRLELARVLLHRPEVLFLDEPTAGLDPQTRRTFWQHLSELRRERGMTVFLTTHYLEEVEGADAVTIVDRGKAVAQGSPSELKARLPPELAQGRPALEDVFVHLTGGAIREEEASKRDQVRREIQRRGETALMRTLETIYALCMRELLRFGRERSSLYASLARPVLWLIVLGSGMHNAFRGQTGVPYAAYLLPGVVAMTVLFGGLFAGVSTVWDREFGFLKEVLIAPVSRLSIVLGKVLAGTLTTALQALLTLLFAPLVGVELPLAGLLPVIGIVLLTSAGVVGLALCIAARLKTFEGFSNLANLVALPLFFLSGSMYPIDDAPPWLAPLIQLNPITYAVDAQRQLLIGVGHHALSTDVLVVLGFTVATVGAAAYSFKRAY